jgi:hypothetical protein
MRKRMVVLGLAVFALMVLSMTLSMARSWPINPIFLAPGLREAGAYTMIVPGTYGHLIPIRPFPWSKYQQDPVLIPSRTGSEDPMDQPGSSLAAPGSGSGTVSSGPGSGKIGGGTASPVGSENMGMPMGTMLSGGTASNHVEYLENDLRDAIRKLNAK